MVPAPMAIGLTLCHYAAIEEGTHDITLAGCFVTLRARAFPFRSPPFWVFASLVGGQGEGTAALAITRSETDEELFRVRRRLVLRDRLSEVRILFRLSNCVFPAPGAYFFTLLLDGEWMAHHRVLVLEKEVST
jgi:hypothetical protein